MKAGRVIGLSLSLLRLLLLLLLLLVLLPFIASTITAGTPLGGSVAALARSGTSALRARGRTGRGHSLGTAPSALARVSHHRALADPFENMRLWFEARATRHNRRNRTDRRVARFRAGDVGRIWQAGHRAGVWPSRNAARFGAAHLGRIRPRVAVGAGLGTLVWLHPTAAGVACIRTTA